MRVVLLGINSKYVHTLLSIRYLKQYLGQESIIYETNINVPRSKTLADLFNLSPTVIAISTYVFNIDYVNALIKDILVVMPSVKIIVGGFECDSIPDFQNKHSIFGEGEMVIKNAVLGSDKNYYADKIASLDDIISPYDDDYISLGKTKILYFESSRGCPFSCSYCMSAFDPVRYFSLERVKRDLNKIMQGNVMQIKFVDRTFNANQDRAYEIFSHIIKNYSLRETNFHFEMAPELFSDKIFNLLDTAPKGLLQFEIGVQSFNEAALKACNRKMNASVVCENIARLKSKGNIHIHTDLIAGLPNEDLNSFKSSFNKLFALKSDMLQLGFLKLLPKSRLKAQQEEFGYKSLPLAPYEIVESKWLSYANILELKVAEAALDRYYNSGKFPLAINYLVEKAESPYDFFLSLGNYLVSNNAFEGGISAIKTADLLFDFGKTLAPQKQLADTINQDFLNSGNARKWKRETANL